MATSTGLSPRLAATLAYSGWWMTGLIFWAVERRSRFVRRHAAQAIVGFGFVAALMTVFAILAVLALSIVPRASVFLAYAAGLIWLGGLVLWGIAMWRAANGHAWTIPIAAGLVERMVGDGDEREERGPA